MESFCINNQKQDVIQKKSLQCPFELNMQISRLYMKLSPPRKLLDMVREVICLKHYF